MQKMLQRRDSLWLPCPRHPARFLYLRRRQIQTRNRIPQVAVACLIVPVGLRSRQIEPHPGRHAVLRHAHPPHVTRAHLRLPRRIAPVRGFEEPLRRYQVVLWYSLTPSIEDPKQSLGIAITLFGGLSRPFKGSAVVFRQTLAFMMHAPEIVLSGRVPSARERQEILRGPGVITNKIRLLSYTKTGMNGRHRRDNNINGPAPAKPVLSGLPASATPPVRP